MQEATPAFLPVLSGRCFDFRPEAPNCLNEGVWGPLDSTLNPRVPRVRGGRVLSFSGSKGEADPMNRYALRSSSGQGQRRCRAEGEAA